MVNTTYIPEVVVILDCCFPGGAATIAVLGNGAANLRKGLSILTASRDDQPSMETADRRGQVSSYLEAALPAGDPTRRHGTSNGTTSCRAQLRAGIREVLSCSSSPL